MTRTLTPEQQARVDEEQTRLACAERRLAKRREWYAANRSKVYAAQRAWARANPEKMRAIKRAQYLQTKENKTP